VLRLIPIAANHFDYWHGQASRSVWLGQGAARLGLTEDQAAPTRDALGRVLQGCSPSTGAPLLRAPGRPGARRPGWDLVVAAPKSVSLLAEATDPAPVLDAFHSAVRQTVDLVPSLMPIRVRGVEATGELVVAAFEHRRSDAGDPHLHAHVVIANLAAAPGGEWRCLRTPFSAGRDGLRRSFHLALRHSLRQHGLHLDWDIGPWGMGEITAVPRAARAAASRRSHHVALDRRRSGAGLSWSAPEAAVRFAGRSAPAGRRSPARGLVEQPGSPRPALAAAGWSPGQADEVLAAAQAMARSGPAPAPTPHLDELRAAVERELAGRRSAFNRDEVLIAVSRVAPQASLQQALDWTAQLWEGLPQVDRTRRTSPTAQAERDRALLAVGLDPSAAQAHPPRAAGDDRAGAFDEVVAALTGGPRVCVLNSGPWLAQAAVIDAARQVWQQRRWTVDLVCPGGSAPLRWQALTSLRPGAAPQPLGSAGRVVVVDAADSLSPASLSALLESASGPETRVVLVNGGTQPRPWPPRADALADLGRSHLALRCPAQGLPEWPLVDLGVAPTAPSGQTSRPYRSPSGLVAATGSGADTVARLVDRWRAQVAGTLSLADPWLLAFGPEEAEGLNRAARRSLGLEQCPGVTLGSRPYALGERVLALRRLGGVPAGSSGLVVDAGADRLTVSWPARGGDALELTTIDAQAAAKLTYGYATTPPYARGWRAPLFVLGDPLDLGRQVGPIVEGWVTAPAPSSRAAEALGESEARHRAAMDYLTAGWPDEALLRRAGPRPLDQATVETWQRRLIAHGRTQERARARQLEVGERSIGPE
jgi:conjugative relaxase-like TrwC/TraI family protein